jgi:hypothetical protein
VCVCSLPQPVLAGPPAVVWPQDSNDPKYASVAQAAVAIAFQGMRPASSPHNTHLRYLLTKHGWALRDHPMWLHTSSLLPHDGVIRRLSLTLDIQLPPIEVGYQDSGVFVDQLARFVAWYAVPRSSPAHATVLSRLASLASGLDGDSESEEPATSGLPREPEAAAGVVTGAGPVYSELDTQERGLLGQQAAAGVLGITATDSIRDALRTVQNPVVLEGLLNNQHAPAGIPKGTLCAQVDLLARATWILLCCVALALD